MSAYSQITADSLNQVEILSKIYGTYAKNEDNPAIAKKYAQEFKIKAQEFKVAEYICYGYYYLANSSEGVEKIEYLDTIIYDVSEQLAQKADIRFPEMAYEAKADYFYDTKQV